MIQIQEPDLHRIFTFRRDIWRSYGRISVDLDEMLRVNRCRDMDELINCPIRIIVRIHESDLHRIFEF